MSMHVLLQKMTKQRTPSLKQFQQWTNAIIPFALKNKKLPCKEITIRIVGRKESAALNHQFRKKNYPTNVLSFAYQHLLSQRDENLGDLIFCADVIAKEAKEQKKSQRAHWAHLTAHGILHLLNYDHIRDKDAEVMESLEIKILKRLGYGNPYV